MMQAAAEPILVNGIAVDAGCFVLWMAHTLLQVRDDVRSTKTALFGEEDASEPEGLKHDVRRLSTQFDVLSNDLETHIAGDISWRDENSRSVTAANGRFHHILSRIERQLGIKEEA